MYSPSLDTLSKYNTAIEIEHAQIHAGNHYFVCGYTTLNSGADIDFQLTTPNTATTIHMSFGIEGTGATIVSVYEDAAVTADGTPVTARNNDRNSTNETSLTLLQSEGTVTTAGTVILAEAVGVTGSPVATRGGLVERDKELILKKNTTYRFLIASNSNDNIISYCGEWYEI